MINRDDLNDPLDDILGGTPSAAKKPAVEHKDFMPAAEPSYKDRCPKCNGTGKFYGYSGRTVGNCFKCKGTGKLEFKSAPEVRAAGRAKAHAKKIENVTSNWNAFATNNEAVAAWITKNASTFDFASAMAEAVRKYGDLTERQMAACVKCMATAAARTVEREAKLAASSTEIDVSKLDAAFATARANGAVVAAIRTGSIIFSLAKASGKNPGAIYAKDRSSGTYLGKIMGGRFSAGYECTPAYTAEIVEAAADPKAAALRFANATNECSVCGRLLTDPASKAAGIGPVCANKFGW